MNKVPFWEPARDYFRFREQIMSAIDRVLSNGELVLGFGKDIPKLEEDFAKYVGTKHAIMCGAGTHALYLTYRALGIGPGDEVIVPSHTFAATFDQIIALGAKPVFADIGEDGLIDPEEIDRLVTGDTKAVVVVHLEGKVCDMGKILRKARQYENLLIIEDAAQALGASWNGQRVGSIGVAGCFSLFPAKILGSVGNAGMITTDDDALAEKLRMLRCNYNLGKNPDINNGNYGMNMEPDNIQAAVLNVKFPHHDENLKRRAEIASMYDEAFKDLPIGLPLKQDGRVYQDYVILVGLEKDAFCEHLKQNGIGILGHNLIPHHKYHKLKIPFLRNTDIYVKNQIRIPCNQNITNEEAQEVIKAIRAFYQK